MFSRGFTTKVPRTFAACEQWLIDHAREFKRKGFCTLGYNTELHQAEGYFFATFHGNPIVRFYPEYKTIDACGYEGSPTTQGRISALANVHMSSNSRCGFDEHIRVSGYPYRANMRIDNYGNVLDKHPDTKTVNEKEVVKQYVALWRKIEKTLAGRWAVGEWAKHGGTDMFLSIRALMHVEDALDSGETFLPHDDVVQLFGTYTTKPDLKDAIKAVREILRHDYYRRNGAYITLEITND